MPAAQGTSAKLILWLRHLIDLAFFCLLLVQMSLSYVDADIHAWTGIAMCALAIAHILINRRAFAGLARKRRTSALFICDLLLIAWLIAEAITGIGLTREILPSLTFARGHGRGVARTIHALVGYWGFLVMAVHTGLHAQRVRGSIACWPMGRPGRRALVVIVVAALIAAGGLSFVGLRFPEFLLPADKAAFLTSSTPAAAHYAMLVVLFLAVATLTQIIVWMLRCRKHRRVHPASA